jgi:predicted ATPase
LLRNRRQQLHARIANVLEVKFPEVVETQPELLARHCTEAGLVEKAVDYRLRSGKQAFARGAMAEAEAELRKGLHLLYRQQGDTPHPRPGRHSSMRASFARN